MKGQTKEEASVVIDLENAGDREFFTEGNTDKSASQSSYDDKGTDIAGQVGKYAATQVLQQGQQQVRNALNFYANIDILRPYFDVEPIQVRDRLLRSLVPVKPSSMQQSIYSELYGPLMLVFTLVAVLLFGMKSSETIVREGTLFGTAFGISFSYWFGASIFYYAIAFLCSTKISFIEMLSLTGYALFGTCLCLLSTTLYPSDSQTLFIINWLLFGGLSSLKMGTVLLSRTWGHLRQGLFVAIAVAAFHLLFLYYLKRSYVNITIMTSTTTKI